MYNWTGGQWTLTKHRKFVWAGWLMLMELDSSGGTGQGGTGVSPVRSYTWGLDLAGQNRHSAPSPFKGEGWGEGLLEAASGIGGLLAVHLETMPARVSLVDVLRLLRHGLDRLMVAAIVVNPDRPGCVQPRVVKRRPLQYALMTRPRGELKRELMQNQRRLT